MPNRPPILHRLFHSLRQTAPWAFEPVFVYRRRKQLRRMIADGHYDPAPDRLVHFADYERASPGREIPHVLHQTWKNDTIPAEFDGNVAGFGRLHPGWRRELWTDAAMEDLVREHFPQYLEKYLALPKNIMRADLFRYMVLWVHGGLYSDLDVEFFKPHDELVDDCALLLSAETDDTRETPFIGQHLLAGCRRHEFWADLLAEALDRPVEEVRDFENPLDVSGPNFVTRVWRRGKDKYRAKVLLNVYLSAPAWLQHPKFSVPPAAYSLHACAGSWR